MKQCRVDGCPKAARTRDMCSACYERTRYRQIAYGRWESGHVDAQPVREHILALREKGIGNNRLRELTGVSHNTIQVIVTGRPERGSGPSKKVMRATADKILAVPVPDVAFRGPAKAGVTVPSIGTTRRLQALVAIGYTQRGILAHLGWRWEGNHLALFHGRGDLITARKAREVAALFTRLAMTPGPSARSRTRASNLGWAPPLAWDDNIDDPDATPVSTEPDGLRDVDSRLAELERLVSFGERPIDAMVRVGWKQWGTVITAYNRRGKGRPPWCKHGHRRHPGDTIDNCRDCTAIQHEKKAAS